MEEIRNRVSLLMFGKTGRIRAKNIKFDKGHFWVLKAPITDRPITKDNTYAPNHKAAPHIKHML